MSSIPPDRTEPPAPTDPRPAPRRFEIGDLWVTVGAAVAGWALGGLTGILLVAGGVGLGRLRRHLLALAAVVCVALSVIATLADSRNQSLAFTDPENFAAITGRMAGLLVLALAIVAVLEARVIGGLRWPEVGQRVRRLDVPGIGQGTAVACAGAGVGALLVGLPVVAGAAAIGALLAIALGSSRSLRRLGAEWSARTNGDEVDATSGGGQIIRGSSWVMVGFVAQAGTGIVFWIAAARLYPAEDVGLATGLFTSLQFVNFLTAMGLPELLARYHPTDGRPDPWFSISIVTTVATSLLGSVAYLGFVGTETLEPLRALGAFVGLALFFSLSAGSAIALLVDARFMTGRHWTLVFWRLLSIGALRIPLLWLPHGTDDALWIFVVMAGPIALSGLWGLWRLHGFGVRPAWRLDRASRPAVLRFAGVNYLAHLAILAPQFGLPVIVFLAVTPVENAAFFLAWSIAAVAAIMPMTISRVLLSEGSRDEAGIDRLAGTALKLALAVIGVATIVVLPAERVIVAVYGADYRPAGTILPLLIAGCLPWSVTVISLAYSRIHQDHVGTVIVSGAVALGVIGSALVLVPDQGLDGGALAWFWGNVVAAVVATLAYLRLRRLDPQRVAVAADERQRQQRGESVPPS